MHEEDAFQDVEDATQKVADLMVGILLYIPAMLLSGLVFMWLWYWFIVPFGVTALTLPWAMGISLLVSFAVFQYRKNDAKLTEIMLVNVLVNLWAWGIGWVISLCM